MNARTTGMLKRFCVALPVLLAGTLFVCVVLKSLEHWIPVTASHAARLIIFYLLSMAFACYVMQPDFKRRKLHGLCPTCGYNLAGNVSGVCPECGSPIIPGPPPRACGPSGRRSAPPPRGGGI